MFLTRSEADAAIFRGACVALVIWFSFRVYIQGDMGGSLSSRIGLNEVYSLSIVTSVLCGYSCSFKVMLDTLNTLSM